MEGAIYQFPMSFGTARVISLAYIDEEGEFVKVPVLITDDIRSDTIIEKEFARKGMMYNSIIDYAKVNPEKITNMRLVSDSIAYANIKNNKI